VILLFYRVCCEIELQLASLLVISMFCFSVASKQKLIDDPASAARHVLCEKQGKINEAYKKLQDGWLDNGDKVPPAEFAKVRGKGPIDGHSSTPLGSRIVRFA